MSSDNNNNITNNNNIFRNNFFQNNQNSPSNNSPQQSNNQNIFSQTSNNIFSQTSNNNNNSNSSNEEEQQPQNNIFRYQQEEHVSRNIFHNSTQESPQQEEEQKDNQIGSYDLRQRFINSVFTSVQSENERQRQRQRISPGPSSPSYNINNTNQNIFRNNSNSHNNNTNNNTDNNNSDNEQKRSQQERPRDLYDHNQVLSGSLYVGMPENFYYDASGQIQVYSHDANSILSKKKKYTYNHISTRIEDYYLIRSGKFRQSPLKNQVQAQILNLNIFDSNFMTPSKNITRPQWTNLQIDPIEPNISPYSNNQNTQNNIIELQSQQNQSQNIVQQQQQQQQSSNIFSQGQQVQQQQSNSQDCQKLTGTIAFSMPSEMRYDTTSTLNVISHDHHIILKQQKPKFCNHITNRIEDYYLIRSKKFKNLENSTGYTHFVSQFQKVQSSQHCIFDPQFMANQDTQRLREPQWTQPFNIIMNKKYPPFQPQQNNLQQQQTNIFGNQDPQQRNHNIFASANPTNPQVGYLRSQYLPTIFSSSHNTQQPSQSSNNYFNFPHNYLQQQFASPINSNFNTGITMGNPNNTTLSNNIFQNQPNIPNSNANVSSSIPVSQLNQINAKLHNQQILIESLTSELQILQQKMLKIEEKNEKKTPKNKESQKNEEQTNENMCFNEEILTFNDHEANTDTQSQKLNFFSKEELINIMQPQQQKPGDSKQEEEEEKEMNQPILQSNEEYQQQQQQQQENNIPKIGQITKIPEKYTLNLLIIKKYQGFRQEDEVIERKIEEFSLLKSVSEQNQIRDIALNLISNNQEYPKSHFKYAEYIFENKLYRILEQTEGQIKVENLFSQTFNPDPQQKKLILTYSSAPIFTNTNNNDIKTFPSMQNLVELEDSQLQKMDNFEILFEDKFKLTFDSESDIRQLDLNQAQINLDTIQLYQNEENYPEINQKLNKKALLSVPILDLLKKIDQEKLDQFHIYNDNQRESKEIQKENLQNLLDKYEQKNMFQNYKISSDLSTITFRIPSTVLPNYFQYNIEQEPENQEKSDNSYEEIGEERNSTQKPTKNTKEIISSEEQKSEKSVEQLEFQQEGDMGSLQSGEILTTDQQQE